MIPTLRSEAKAQGSKHYFPGTACANGHVAPRFTSCGYCTVCSKERAERKGEELKAYYKARYEANKVVFLAEERKRRLLNPTSREASKRWQAANAEKVRGYKQRNKHKRRAIVGSFTGRDIRRLECIQRHECAICSADIRDGYHIDHIIPIVRGGTNWCGNLQLLCAHCNYRKSSKLPIRFKADRLLLAKAA